jgi:hypothetical protein
MDGLVSLCRGPKPMDPVHVAVNLFHGFSNRKIKTEILENTRTLEILQKHPKLFQNYILVPLILHLGPCIYFYIYNSVLFLINSVYIIFYSTY